MFASHVYFRPSDAGGDRDGQKHEAPARLCSLRGRDAEPVDTLVVEGQSAEKIKGVLDIPDARSATRVHRIRRTKPDRKSSPARKWGSTIALTSARK